MNFWGIVSLCLSVLPRCLTVMILVSFQTDSVDPDQTPVPSGFTMFAICLHLFGSLCRKMIPIKNGGCSFSYIRIRGKLEESVMKKAFFCIFENKDAKLISAFVSATRLEQFIY